MTTDPAPPRSLRLRYRNHRGEVTERLVRPSALWYGKTEWHPEPQWLLDAYDLDREADRTFAMRAILRWGEPEPDGGSAATDGGTDAEDAALVDALIRATGHPTALRPDIAAARDALLARIIHYKVALKVAHRALAGGKGAGDDRT